MTSCFARNPLLLINDHNLSGPRLPFQPDCRWQHALPAWVAWWWYVLANTTCVRWRDKEGECRSSISKVLSLPKSVPGLVKGLTIFYEELGPWLGTKKAKKTTMTKTLTPPSPSFSKVVVVDAADAKTILCRTFVSNNYICFRCSRFPGRPLIVFLPHALAVMLATWLHLAGWLISEARYNCKKPDLNKKFWSQCSHKGRKQNTRSKGLMSYRSTR